MPDRARALQQSEVGHQPCPPPAAPLQAQLQQAIEDAGFTCSHLPTGAVGRGSTAGATECPRAALTCDRPLPTEGSTAHPLVLAARLWGAEFAVQQPRTVFYGARPACLGKSVRRGGHAAAGGGRHGVRSVHSVRGGSAARSGWRAGGQRVAADQPGRGKACKKKRRSKLSCS